MDGLTRVIAMLGDTIGTLQAEIARLENENEALRRSLETPPQP